MKLMKIPKNEETLTKVEDVILAKEYLLAGVDYVVLVLQFREAMEDRSLSRAHGIVCRARQELRREGKLP